MLRPPVLSRMLPTLIGSAAASPALLRRAALLPKASAPEAVRKNWRRLNFMAASSHLPHNRVDHSARFLLVLSARGGDRRRHRSAVVSGKRAVVVDRHLKASSSPSWMTMAPSR